MNRREFVKASGAGVALAGFPGSYPAFAESINIKGISMCDWTMGLAASSECIIKAATIGLDGVQVSVGTDPDNIPLRNKSVLSDFKKLSKKNKIVINSVAAGSILNKYPLATEPMSTVFVIDAIEAAAELGANNILTAFFGAGDLRLKDGTGNLIDEPLDGYSSYKLNEPAVEKVIMAMRQIAPRAEDLGIHIGLENTLTARQNMEIMDAIGSAAVKVYYDVGNSWGSGYNVPYEIELLGLDRICEVHFKDWNTKMLGDDEGQVDFRACALSLNNIGYDKWIVLETAGRKDQFEADTAANIAYSKSVFKSRPE